MKGPREEARVKVSRAGKAAPGEGLAYSCR